MASFRWRGAGAGTKSAWNDGRNWVDDLGNAYAQAVYPGDTTRAVSDDVTFDAALGTGALSPLGYDATALTKLRSFHVGSTFNGTIGGPASWLKIQCTDVSINAVAAGAIYLNGVSTVGLQNLSIEAGTVHLDGRTENATIMAGTVDWAATTGVIATSLTIGSSSATAPTVTLGASMTLPATIYCNAGTVTSSTGTTTLLINGGSWTQALGDITTVRVASSAGSFYWSGGNITTAYVTAGLFTVGTSVVWRRIGNIYCYNAATVNLDNGVGSILLTGAVYYYGGTLTPLANGKISTALVDTYAGASDAKMGIVPQSVASGATVNGDGIALNINDRLDVYCTVGAMTNAFVATFTAWSDDASDFASEADLISPEGKEVAFSGTDDNKTKIISIWGYELSSTTPWVRVKIVGSGGDAGLVAAVYVKHSVA